MGYVVTVSPAVKQEMAEAYEWYKARSERAAGAFRAEVLAAFDLIAIDPVRWSLWDESIRRYVLKQYPYTVYFAVTPGEVRILAVGHHRRQAGYWRGR